MARDFPQLPPHSIDASHADRSTARRALLKAAGVLPAMWLLAPMAARAATPQSAAAQAAAPDTDALRELERKSGGRLGVVVIDTGSGKRVGYRDDERFPFCSTFKVMLSGAILARSGKENDLLARHIRYTSTDMVNYSPITQKHVGAGMTVADLCAAALQYSDNTAANLLIHQLGGVEKVTAFARSIGDSAFRLDRMETMLNTAIPDDVRDTTTPAAMAESLRKLALGDALPADARTQLQTWLKGNTTGNKRIRAGVPQGWTVGDKTGTGDHGTSNDIAVVWPPSGAPLIVATYFTQLDATARPRDDVLADATRLALAALGR